MNAKKNDGFTALMLASQFGYGDVVRALLDAKADVNAKTNDGRTGLIMASRNGHGDVVQLLKSAGALQ